ncbi:hypothetical protein MEQU1_001994 [Malassezia equina]|uniref:C3H1-type domain-containing protein n=1 Tax=Malassezia equina TaxID=1381935 RepID=A0AAF0J3U8_9BASI|nr:hypothetical protein MEQU1_001994 [Malassezia equina]
MDPRQAALLSEIAQLSGAIDRQRSRIRGRGGYTHARPSRHRSLVLRDTDEGEWVRRRSRQSMALVHRAVYEPPRPPTETTTAEAKPAAPTRRPAREQIVVDGVPFVFDESGTKLIKASLVAPHTPTETPRQTSVDGEAYVRTKSGNLISRALVVQRRAARAQQARQKRLAALGQQMGRVHREVRARQRAQVREICTFYTRTGACLRGERCPFVHDPARRALCPGALKPSWCEQGLECERRHAKECPDLREKGACTNATCRLAHPTPRPERSAVPSADTLFVRDDAAAGEERYFVAVDEAAPHADGPSDAAGPSHDFVQQHDYIDLDGEASLSDATVESEETDSDAEVERTLGLV